jgi:thiamine kinase-like enzyme
MPTLAHGGYKPAQIIIDSDAVPMRITPVDWETASFNSGFLDVAKFTDGFKPPVLDEMFEAYIREAFQYGLVINPQEMRHVVDCFRLFRVIIWLATAKQRGFTLEQLTRVVDHGEEIVQSLDAQPGRSASGGGLYARP